MRLVGRPIEVYQYLEPLYNDYRKIRLRATGAALPSGLHMSHLDLEPQMYMCVAVFTDQQLCLEMSAISRACSHHH